MSAVSVFGEQKGRHGGARGGGGWGKRVPRAYTKQEIRYLRPVCLRRGHRAIRRRISMQHAIRHTSMQYARCRMWSACSSFPLSLEPTAVCNTQSATFNIQHAICDIWRCYFAMKEGVGGGARTTTSSLSTYGNFPSEEPDFVTMVMRGRGWKGKTL